MARARDPNRDKAFEIWKQSRGEIKLKDIADQLGISEGTVRGWKNKDKWEGQNNETSDQPAPKIEGDELYDQAVNIAREAQMASAGLMQRRLRIGYTRAASLIDQMEQNGVVGPYENNEPRKVFTKKETTPQVTKVDTVPKSTERSNQTERNAPKVMERSKEKVERIDPPPEVDNEDGSLTEKQRLFVLEYLRDFNATRAAMSVGYSKKTAYSIGWELLRKPEIQAEIKRQKEAKIDELGLDVQRVIAEYMKIAFTDVTDILEFGQKEVQVMTMFGPMYEGEGENKKPVTKVVNYVDLKDSDDIDGTIISEVKQGKDGVSIKLHDKMRALEKLEKYVGFMTEEQRLKLEKTKLEVTHLRGDDDQQEDDGFLEALDGKVQEIWDDHEEDNEG
ncbi:terminase small subunit [Brevibacillus porteri]|uniref:terminase small subunit n=1 Tax=Brevibacillus porteri TaxID=2126350 RepID=UPI003638C015